MKPPGRKRSRHHSDLPSSQRAGRVHRGVEIGPNDGDRSQVTTTQIYTTHRPGTLFVSNASGTHGQRISAPTKDRAEPSSSTRRRRPAAVIEIPSDDSDSADPQRDFWSGADVFITTLYYPYKDYLELPGMEADWGDTRLILVKTQSGRQYKVKLDKEWGSYVVCDGWNLVVAAECLAPKQTVVLEYLNNHLSLTTSGPTPVGKQPGFVQAHGPDIQLAFNDNHYILGPGAELTQEEHIAMIDIWAAAASSSPMYVCQVRFSQKERKAMYFSTEYSKLLPKKIKTVALRFVGSPVAIAGNMQLYQQGINQITRGWDDFVKEHNIAQGDVLVFRCFRGPSVWEVLVARARF